MTTLDTIGAANPGYAEGIRQARAALEGFAKWLRIRPEGGGALIPLRLNVAQERVLAQLRGHKRVLILKGRRLGVTTLALAAALWEIHRRRNLDALMVAHRDEDAEAIFQAARLMHENLPDWLRPERFSHNKREIYYPANESRLGIGTARGVGVRRGTALQFVHMTEAAFYPEESETLIAGLLECARAGRVMMETTANGASGAFYDRWMENRDGQGPWTCIFAPWWLDDRNRVALSPEERGDFRVTAEEAVWAGPAALDAGQVAWYRRKAKLLKSKMRSDYPCTDLEAFVESGRHFFDTEHVVAQARKVKPPIRVAENGAALVWEEPKEGAQYVAGGDPCDGTPNGSFAVLSIHRKDEHFTQVARLRGRWVPGEFARLTARWCRAYNHAYVVPERNRLEYVRALVNVEGYRFVFRRRSKTGEQDREAGFLTDGQTRPYMLDVLKGALEGDGETEPWLIINDPVFFGECLTFEDEGGGRYSAASGKYDDSIFGPALALQGRSLGMSKIVRLYRSDA